MNTEDDLKNVAALGIIGLLALVPILVLVNGLVFSTMWAWFIVPTFHVQPLTLGQAMGIGVFVEWLVVPSRKAKETPPLSEALCNVCLKVVVLMGVAALVHAFMMPR